jgi:hypothetical protein
MASRRRGPEGGAVDLRDRWRRRVVLAQGAYYLLVGIWPLVHFPSYTEVVAFALNPFQAQAFGAVIAVLGGSLLEAARREPPGVFTTALAIAVAGAITLVSLIWLPREPRLTGLWLDVVLEVTFAVALVVLYPRAQSDRSRTVTRRR